MTPQELQSLRNLGGECETAADEIDRLRDDLAAALAERDTLRQFAKEIMLAWPDGDVDGADLEDAALTAGILIPTARTAWCGDNCSCAEVHNWDDDALPVQCLRKAAWLLAKDAP